MKDISDILEFYDRSVSSSATRGQDFILRNARSINRVLALFSDEKSRYLYAQEIIYCALCQIQRQEVAVYFSGLMTNDEFVQYVDDIQNHKVFKLFVSPKGKESEYVKAVDMAATFLLEQYRYKDLVRVEEGDICLDGGAFIGDTALYFTEGKPQKIYSFEIDHVNLECLKNKCEEFWQGRCSGDCRNGSRKKMWCYPFYPYEYESCCRKDC